MNAAILTPTRTPALRSKGLGCGCGCNHCNKALSGPSEDLFNTLKGQILTLKRPMKFFSKHPDAWFPLVNREKNLPAGTMIGSVKDYATMDDGTVWFESNVIAPGWFQYDAQAISGRKRDESIKLSDEEKERITKDILAQQQPASKVVTAASDVVESAFDTIEDTLKSLSKGVKYLPWVALAGGVIYVAVRHGDDIKGFFKKKK